MKKVFSGIFLGVILIMTSSPAYAADFQIKVDGVTIASDVNPEVKSNRTMVPLRVISENLGVNVVWTDAQITLTKNDIQVTLKLNRNQVVKNGKTELLDVGPYMKNNRTFVPMRFLAETFGSNITYKNGTVTVETQPLFIDGIKVKALQYEYHMTLGGVVQQINGNGYNEAIYNTFIKNNGSKIEAPTYNPWDAHPIPVGDYDKNAQFDFLDQDSNSIKRFDIYFSMGDLGGVLVHDTTANHWYVYSDTARLGILQLIDTASLNGFVTVMSNTVP